MFIHESVHICKHGFVKKGVCWLYVFISVCMCNNNVLYACVWFQVFHTNAYHMQDCERLAMLASYHLNWTTVTLLYWVIDIP